MARACPRPSHQPLCCYHGCLLSPRHTGSSSVSYSLLWEEVYASPLLHEQLEEMAEQAEQWWERNEYSFSLLRSRRKQQGWGTPCSSRVGGNGASEDCLYPFRPLTIFQSTQVFAKWPDPRHLWYLSVSWTQPQQLVNTYVWWWEMCV